MSDEITSLVFALLAFGIAGYLLATARYRIGHYVISLILLAICVFLVVAVTSVTVHNSIFKIVQTDFKHS